MFWKKKNFDKKKFEIKVEIIFGTVCRIQINEILDEWRVYVYAGRNPLSCDSQSKTHNQTNSTLSLRFH